MIGLARDPLSSLRDSPTLDDNGAEAQEVQREGECPNCNCGSPRARGRQQDTDGARFTLVVLPGSLGISSERPPTDKQTKA